MHPAYVAHRYVGYICSFLSLILNTYLIGLMSMRYSKDLGSYRYLLGLFSVHNILYSFSIATAATSLHSESNWFIVFEDGHLLFLFPLWVRQAMVTLVCAFFSGTLFLLTLHFFYRYMQVCRPQHIYIFTLKRWRCLWVLFLLIAMGIWYAAAHFLLGRSVLKSKVLEETFRREYQLNISEIGYAGSVYRVNKNDGSVDWQWKDCAGMMILLVLYSFYFFSILIFGYLTYTNIRNSVHSAKTRNLQRQLFKSLVVMTSIPVLCIYTPLNLLLLGPLFGVGMGAQGNTFELMLMFCPVIDPIILILMIAKFRRATIGLFRGRNIFRRVYALDPTTAHSSTNH